MKEYKTLIFDLDDILIDNSVSVRYAIESVADKLKLNFDEELYRKWLMFDKAY